jgi:hypothetical protein
MRVRSFTSLHDLNVQARQWLDQVANVRIHGTTQVVPMQRWTQEGLKPINLTPFEEVERHPRKVSADGMISFEANRYSVPYRYVGQVVHVQDQKNGRITIFSGEEVIADHPKALGKRQLVMNKKHFEGLQTSGQHKAPKPMPKLVPNSAPEVHQRDLSVYEQFLDEAVVIQ